MKIMASVSGFTGSPVTLLALLDDDTGVLAISKPVKYREDRIAPDFAFVTNMPLDDCDFRFTDDLMRDAIRSYFALSAQGVVTISNEAQRYQPDNRIERDSIDERGPKYRVSPDLDNGQAAVLALVAFTEHQRNVGAAIAAADELDEYSFVSV